MPVIYGNSKGGIAHRELQPVAATRPAVPKRKKPLPVRMLDWRAVTVAGTVYETPHAADVSLGWVAGTCEAALKAGKKIVNGVAVSYAKPRSSAKGGHRA